ncbi:hypothetical protein SAMN05660420_02958 [Desulfuromusa kysingii]|uniref:Uncharacterized protein n=1 Tax=Desulfuromusa kysingii TaxID=37625 RepID=A0A1H4DHQ2_9BACT|nr:hypothetical protein SAMN05660420_02958 [Desulfuromusa kysingii]
MFAHPSGVESTDSERTRQQQFRADKTNPYGDLLDDLQSIVTLIYIVGQPFTDFYFLTGRLISINSPPVGRFIAEMFPE